MGGCLTKRRLPGFVRLQPISAEPPKTAAELRTVVTKHRCASEAKDRNKAAAARPKIQEKLLRKARQKASRGRCKTKVKIKVRLASDKWTTRETILRQCIVEPLSSELEPLGYNIELCGIFNPGVQISWEK